MNATVRVLGLELLSEVNPPQRPPEFDQAGMHICMDQYRG